jgi:hypothetical protein
LLPINFSGLTPEYKHDSSAGKIQYPLTARATSLSQKHIRALFVAVVIRPPEAGKPQADLETTN